MGLITGGQESIRGVLEGRSSALVDPQPMAAVGSSRQSANVGKGKISSDCEVLEEKLL